MKALVPLNNVEHVDDYIEAGAGEFYIGFHDKEWEKNFDQYTDINRMSGYGSKANPHDFESVLEIIKEIKKKKKIIYVTFNSSMYSEIQIQFIERYFKKLKEVEVDGVIVSCIELVVLAKEIGLNPVISAICGVYNSDIARFYYDHGAKRIILPRDLAISEIERITKAVPSVEYEVFMMRNGCAFSDANCLGFHRSEKCSICASINNANRELMSKKVDFKAKHANELNDMVYTQSFHKYACGLCSMYRFVKMGIAAGKIVGRSDEWAYVCKDISYLKKNADIAKECSSEEEYLERMIFPEDSTFMCKMGLSCYYPEVRF